MKLSYDPECDALLIELVDAIPASSFDYEDGVTAAVDTNGNVIALEILDFRQRLARGGALDPDVAKIVDSSMAASD